MPYAIVQTDLAIPPVEALRRAFPSVQCLTEFDAQTLANDGYGILVKNLSSSDASTLQGALRGEGVETEIVDEAELPTLPPAKFVHRLDCRPDALTIYDPLGRNFPLEWAHIMMIAAGCVRLNEFNPGKTLSSAGRPDTAGGHQSELAMSARRGEEVNLHFVLEIILSRAVLRYSLVADKFNFEYLGERLSPQLPENFASLVRDLARFAPQAALNRGAHNLRDKSDLLLTYPSKNAFFEEIIWWLLRMAGTTGR